MTRRECREHLMILLFQLEFHAEEELTEQMKQYLEQAEVTDEKSYAYIKDKYQKICEKRQRQAMVRLQVRSSVFGIPLHFR